MVEFLFSGGDEIWEAGRRNAETLFGGVKLHHLLTAWTFVATSLVLAYIAWRFTYAANHKGRRFGFLRFVFPRSIYVHRSTFVDIQLLLINQLFSPLSLIIAAGATALIASGTAHALGLIWPGHDPRFEWAFWPLAAFTLALAAVSDLATYVTHRLFHRVPALWEIHKVHHSAEVLSPLTVFRKHPLFDLSARIMKAAMIGPMQGVVFFVFAGPVDALTAFGANLVFALFHMLGAGLRHSHVWLSYGPVLNRILISPAQHQIHHSRAPAHWDKNFGQIFAIWDWLFGTLYVPKRFEELEFGLDDMPSEAFSGVRGGLFRPVGRALGVARQRLAAPVPRRRAIG